MARDLTLGHDSPGRHVDELQGQARLGHAVVAILAHLRLQPGADGEEARAIGREKHLSGQAVHRPFGLGHAGRGVQQPGQQPAQPRLPAADGPAGRRPRHQVNRRQALFVGVEDDQRPAIGREGHARPPHLRHQCAVPGVALVAAPVAAGQPVERRLPQDSQRRAIAQLDARRARPRLARLLRLRLAIDDDRPLRAETHVGRLQVEGSLGHGFARRGVEQHEAMALGRLQAERQPPAAAVEQRSAHPAERAEGDRPVLPRRCVQQHQDFRARPAGRAAGEVVAGVAARVEGGQATAVGRDGQRRGIGRVPVGTEGDRRAAGHVLARGRVNGANDRTQFVVPAHDHHRRLRRQGRRGRDGRRNRGGL